MMKLDQFTQQMSQQAEAIRALVQNISDEQARWKPSPDEWSILEVINHLYDEEGDDFRTHLDLILHHPSDSWPRIDPQGWVTERRYNEREVAQSLGNFLDARKESLAWLAHDLLHLRQLVELHRAYVVRLADPHKVDYAGPWQ
jgi:hypothetical protein